MLKLNLALAVSVGMVAAVHVAGAQKIAEPAIRRFAVGMQSGDRLPPYAVEATSEGWVELTVYATQDWLTPNQPQFPSPFAPTNSRIIVDPPTVRAFTAAGRALLARHVDSTNDVPLRPVILGHGTSRFDLHAAFGKGKLVPDGAFQLCGARVGSAPATRVELIELLQLLDSAAIVARRQRKDALLPTLHRAYSAGEVECAPYSTQARRYGPIAGVPGGTVVPVQFVVDTSGNAEPGSFEFMRTTSPAAANAVRDIMSHWRYAPAEIDGTPVRGIVQTSLVFESLISNARQVFPFDPSALTVTPSADSSGWIRLDAVTQGREAAKEWFSPDTIDAFVARVRAIQDSAATFTRDIAPRDSMRMFSKNTYTGQQFGNAFGLGVTVRGRLHSVTALWAGCGGISHVTSPAPDVAQLQQLSSAAASARATRTTPLLRWGMVFGSDDVSCVAALPLIRIQRADFGRAWYYPPGVIPRGKSARRLNGDVLISVVVDSAGTADASTLELLPNTDHDAAEAARLTLPSLHFRPATRAGMFVKQRVVQVLRFAPAPVCSSSSAGPLCPRRYRDQ